MRIAFLIATLALGLRVGLSAHATVSEYDSAKLTPTTVTQNDFY
jgi:hypothetical protein